MLIFGIAKGFTPPEYARSDGDLGADPRDRALRLGAIRAGRARRDAGREGNKEYVQAARLIGRSSRSPSCSRHILPNVMSPGAGDRHHLAGAGDHRRSDVLSFLGVGAPPTQPSLGTLIRSRPAVHVLGRVVDPFLSRPLTLLAAGALDQSARRLAARRSSIRGCADVVDVPSLCKCARTRRGGSSDRMTPKRRYSRFVISWSRFRRATVSCSPVDHVSFDIAMPARYLGVVGESGAGKSMTGNAVIGLSEPSGPHCRMAKSWLQGRRPSTALGERSGCSRLRGRRMGMIFQDPLTSLNPLLTVGEQLTETIRRAPRASHAAHALGTGPWRRSKRWAFRRLRSASTAIRISSPAACASGW